MAFLRISASGPVLLVAAMLPLAAQTEVEPPVRVYTNADLERFEPLAVDSTPVAPHDDAQWEFVSDFIEREQARIDADRAHRLEQRWVEIEERSVERNRSYVRGVLPYGVYPYGNAHRRHGARPRHHVRSTPNLGGRITPLHARPSLAQVNRAKATRRSGVDAFPSNARKSR
jgi:hypothetical protein